MNDLLSKIALNVSELDVLDGSPPCSEFSIAGKGISDQNALKAYSDVKQANIATLPFDFVELAVLARPKVVVMENVPALASSRAKDVLDRALGALRFPDGKHLDRAYYAAWSVLSASDFGVAQKRRRLFIIGIRRDVATTVGIASDDAVLGIFPTPTHTPLSIRSALQGLQQKSSEVEPWLKSVMTSSLGPAVRRPFTIDLRM